MSPARDVLLVGFGAVGAICAFHLGSAVPFHNRNPDSLIVKRSGLARVTAVARSNYDLVNSAS